MRKNLGDFLCIQYMDTLDTKKGPKGSEKFSCELCDFYCCKKSKYDRHLITTKHKKKTEWIHLSTNGYLKSPEGPKAFYVCECSKKYKFSQGLSKHKKICKTAAEKKELEPKNENDLITFLLKENQEFKQMIMEQNKKNNELFLELAQKPTTTTTNNNITNNKNRFNINFFLNEKCKDAMNITDFVSSLKLTLQDLEKTAELGYVKGLTNIIVNGLNQLDVYKRPIHCSDVKRETLYVKDNDIWEKENDEKQKFTRAIKHISIKNAKQVGDWTKENKGYNDSSNKKSDKYLKIVSEANGGEPEEINKIISNVTTHIQIDKQIDQV
jgi:hypothetical protein